MPRPPFPKPCMLLGKSMHPFPKKHACSSGGMRAWPENSKLPTLTTKVLILETSLAASFFIPFLCLRNDLKTGGKKDENEQTGYRPD